MKVLARASERNVLEQWQGLGYYSRARNLHRCAKIILKKYGGKFPKSYAELIQLPGIGPYTAAAIASISFGECKAVVDGNVSRVLTRVFGIDDSIQSPSGKRKISQLANKLIDCKQPDVFNQAIMEFGALQCTPRLPKCGDCPLEKICVAKRDDLQEFLPVKKKPLTHKHRYFTYFVIRDKGSVLMKERRGNDIWKGLYDFYLVETKKWSPVSALLKSDSLLNSLNIAQTIKPTHPIVHVLSHQKLHVRYVEGTSISSTPIINGLAKEKLKFYSMRTIKSLPKPILIKRYLLGA